MYIMWGVSVTGKNVVQVKLHKHNKFKKQPAPSQVEVSVTINHYRNASSVLLC